MRALWAIAGLILLLGCGKSAPVSERERATEMLARYLGEELRPKAALVISNPFTQSSGRPAEVYEFERAGIAGLKRGFGDPVAVKVGFPELRREAIENPASVQIDPSATTPLSFLVAENSFQQLVEQHRDCEIVVSLIGLPVKLSAFPAWTKPGPPRLALLLPDWRIIGNREAVLAAFQSGKLAAAVVRGSKAGDPFTLVTSKNVAELWQTQPELFTR